MEPSQSSASSTSANKSTSVASTQHLNSSIGEENAIEMACGNGYGISSPQNKIQTRTDLLSGMCIRH
eukprot:1201534-Ditylum_brightwellii.AAC.1